MSPTHWTLLSRATVLVVAILTFSIPAMDFAQSQGPKPPFDDHAEMMKLLGIRAVRGGAQPNGPNADDEATANKYLGSVPDVFLMNNGTKVTNPEQWSQRRRELVEIFEREIYGRVPKNAPKVTWEVTGITPGMSGNVPTITKTLIGHVDNRSYPSVKVNIQASFTVPANATQNVPIMIEFGFGMGFGGGRPGSTAKPWTDQAIEHGWGFGSITPTTIQPDSNHVELGVIGLTNKGKPRKADDWGAIRAWGWGLSRLIDYFEKDKSSMVDAKSVGIEGVSRYGKAALAAQAFDPRVAVAFVASSGAGGAKLLRHVFGERLENIAGGALFWMAGNWLKYGATDPEKTVADLPVDSHELIALCAPRPCFISYGIPERGDPNWVDAHGSFMAGVLASPVYRLLGKKAISSGGDDIMTPMPPIQTLVGGELAWRQHEGGHEATPNWPTFFTWVSSFITAPPVPTNRKPYQAPSDLPSSRTDGNSLIAHFQLVQKAAMGGIDVYFEGDSIIRRWGTSDTAWKDNYENWKANFWGWNAGNFGWGADSTQNILWRLKNGEIENVNPKVIVILAGTNNVGSGQSVDQVTRGVQSIVDLCHEKAPKAKIILTAIFPRNDSMGFVKTINGVNENLAKLASRPYIRFLNVNAGLADQNGKLFEGMTIDNLHPSVKGFQVWADGLKPILTELLGPRAATDHAPPPTGDPSAAPPRQGGRPGG